MNIYNNNNLVDIRRRRNSSKDKKTAQNAFRRLSSSKQTYLGNIKQYSPNIENDNLYTNIDFNIIIDKAKTNCCEGCFGYQQISQVCNIF